MRRPVHKPTYALGVGLALISFLICGLFAIGVVPGRAG